MGSLSAAFFLSRRILFRANAPETINGRTSDAAPFRVTSSDILQAIVNSSD